MVQWSSISEMCATQLSQIETSNLKFWKFWFEIFTEDFPVWLFTGHIDFFTNAGDSYEISIRNLSGISRASSQRCRLPRKNHGGDALKREKIKWSKKWDKMNKKHARFERMKKLEFFIFWIFTSQWVINKNETIAFNWRFILETRTLSGREKTITRRVIPAGTRLTWPGLPYKTKNSITIALCALTVRRMPDVWTLSIDLSNRSYSLSKNKNSNLTCALSLF